MPGWLTVRLPKDSEKVVRSKLKRQARLINKSRPPRLQPLGEGWWLKRPKEEGAEIPALERLIGPAAYLGRQQYVERKKGKASRPRGRVTGGTRPVVRIDMKGYEIPSNTIISERKSERVFSSDPVSRIGTLNRQKESFQNVRMQIMILTMMCHSFDEPIRPIYLDFIKVAHPLIQRPYMRTL
jgi:hypothetical protein